MTESLSFEDCYPRLCKDAIGYTARQIYGSAVLGDADVEAVASDVLDQLDREWATIAAGRRYAQIRSLMCHRIRHKVADAAIRQKRIRDGAERSYLRDSATQESDDLEDEYAERDLGERMRRFIERLPEPDRSVLLFDEAGILRHGITEVYARQIRSRWARRIRKGLEGNSMEYAWLATC